MISVVNILVHNSNLLEYSRYFLGFFAAMSTQLLVVPTLGIEGWVITGVHC